jgi:hypothetical protein
MNVTAASTSREIPTSERATSRPTSGIRNEARLNELRRRRAWRRRLAT